MSSAIPVARVEENPLSEAERVMATSVDLFTIWVLVLEGIGFSCLTKVRRGACMGVVFGWWLVLVLGGAGLSAAFS